MTIYEIVTIAISILGLILGASAHIRINNKDSNKVSKSPQTINGDDNNQAGRDIN